MQRSKFSLEMNSIKERDNAYKMSLRQLLMEFKYSPSEIKSGTSIVINHRCVWLEF